MPNVLILRNRNGSMRPGWKVAGFLALCALSLVAAVFVTQMFVPRWAWRDVPPWPVVGLAAGFMLAATWLCVRWEQRRLRDVGVFVDRSRAQQFGVGLILGLAMFGAYGAVLWITGGLSWAPNPAFSPALMAAGTGYYCFAVLAEELAMRGYALRRLADGVGRRMALGVLAMVMASYHVVGAALGGGVGLAELAWMFTAPAVGGVLFGVAALRSGSIALPLGIHPGGNWIQWHLLTSPGTGSSVGLWIPTTTPWLADHPLVIRTGYLMAMCGGLIAVVVLTRRSQAPVAKDGDAVSAAGPRSS